MIKNIKSIGNKKSKGIKVVQFSKSGEPIKVWNSMEEASKTLHISKGNICNVCKGREGIYSAGGYQWKYLKDIEGEM